MRAPPSKHTLPTEADAQKDREACSREPPSRPPAVFWVGLGLESLTVSQMKEIFLYICHLKLYFQVRRGKNYNLTHAL